MLMRFPFFSHTLRLPFTLRLVTFIRCHTALLHTCCSSTRGRFLPSCRCARSHIRGHTTQPHGWFTVCRWLYVRTRFTTDCTRLVGAGCCALPQLFPRCTRFLRSCLCCYRLGCGFTLCLMLTLPRDHYTFTVDLVLPGWVACRTRWTDRYTRAVTTPDCYRI